MSDFAWRTFERTWTKRGITIDIETGCEPDNGWAVASGTAERFPYHNFHYSDVVDFVESHLDELYEPNRYLGGWFDEATQCYWLDVSEVVATQAVAEHLGRARNQTAIYGLADHVDLRL